MDYGHRHYIVDKKQPEEHPVRDFLWLFWGALGYTIMYIILATQTN